MTILPTPQQAGALSERSIEAALEEWFNHKWSSDADHFQDRMRAAISAARINGDRTPTAYMVRPIAWRDNEKLWRSIEPVFLERYRTKGTYDIVPLYKNVAVDISHVRSILASEIECGIFEQHVLPALAVAEKVLADPELTCQTCGGHGMIGGPSYQAPDEGGEPCPDCNAPAPSNLVDAADGDNLASMTRMFHAACADLGLISEALGLDPDDGGAEPIIDAIESLKSERDKWVDAQFSAPATVVHAGTPMRADFDAFCDAHLDAQDTVDREWLWRFIQEWSAAPTPSAALAGASEIEQYLLSVLPSVYYMDPPDGGSVSLLEQLRRMADDAAKYRAAAQPASVDAVPVATFPERDPSKSVEQQGLFRKFDVRRVDGSDQHGGKHYGCRYFVLDMNHDAHAPPALRAYADSCAESHPQLAADLRRDFPAPPASTGADAQAPVAPPEDTYDRIQRVVTEYEGAIQEDDEEIIKPAREALMALLVEAKDALLAAPAQPAVVPVAVETVTPWTDKAVDQIAEILACEIECSIFEKHVIPALEVARKVRRPVNIETDPETLEPEDLVALAGTAVAWMVDKNFKELFTDLEEAHKYATTIRSTVISLYAPAAPKDQV